MSSLVTTKLIFTSTQVHQEGTIANELILELSILQELFDLRPQPRLAANAVLAGPGDDAQELGLRVGVELEQSVQHLARLFDLQPVQIDRADRLALRATDKSG